MPFSLLAIKCLLFPYGRSLSQAATNFSCFRKAVKKKMFLTSGYFQVDYEDMAGIVRIVSKETLPPTTTCNGKLHNRDGYCQKPAGWGTNHPGEGRCRLHGGRSTGRRTDLAMKFKPFIDSEENRELYDKILGDKTLDGEIALSKVEIAALLKDLSEWRGRLRSQLELLTGDVDSKQIDDFFFRNSRLFRRLDTLQKALRQQLDLASKIIQRDQEIREGKKYLVDVRGINELAQKQMIIVGNICGDCPRRNELAKQFREIKLTGSSLPPLVDQLPAEKALEGEFQEISEEKVHDDLD